ncbi:hypothetical protein CHUAL_005318 [Chamberlinius hualienensis]
MASEANLIWINESLEITWNSTPFSVVFDNLSDPSANASVQLDLLSPSLHHLFHQPIDLQFRIAILWIFAVLGSIGNLLVIIWICGHRNWRSRINMLILHLALADTFVIVMAICPQLAWEYALRQWEMGDGMCRIFKFLQTSIISVSNYMVVVLAIDRYCAIRRPLKKAFTVGCLTGSAWTLAIILNFSNFFLFETKEIDGEVYCRNKLYDLPEIFMQAYITVIAVLVFVIPLAFICFTYARIFQKIANRKKLSVKSGKIQLQATSSSTLPKAKVKTFRMTVVIVSSFLLCGTPYFVCDMWRIYGHQNMPSAVWSVFGALAVSNSCTNSYVFLGFNSTTTWWLNFLRGGQQRSRNWIQTSSGVTQPTNTDTSIVVEILHRTNTLPSVTFEAASTVVKINEADKCGRQLLNEDTKVKSRLL